MTTVLKPYLEKEIKINLLSIENKFKPDFLNVKSNN
jgi:hypothetical protein